MTSLLEQSLRLVAINLRVSHSNVTACQPILEKTAFEVPINANQSLWWPKTAPKSGQKNTCLVEPGQVLILRDY
jgi:hypothetical protein